MLSHYSQRLDNVVQAVAFLESCYQRRVDVVDTQTRILKRMCWLDKISDLWLLCQLKRSSDCETKLMQVLEEMQHEVSVFTDQTQKAVHQYTERVQRLQAQITSRNAVDKIFLQKTHELVLCAQEAVDRFASLSKLMSKSVSTTEALDAYYSLVDLTKCNPATTHAAIDMDELLKEIEYRLAAHAK